MEEQNKLQPSWLTPLLEAKFYSLCESHDSKNTFFCLDLDCRGLVLCEGCLKDKKHHGHQVLQVYKASRQVVLKVRDLHQLMDLSYIQPYINNDFKVVYINQRSQKEQPNNSNSTAKCERCGWQLLPGTTSKFCSIECKINYEGNFRKQPNKIKCESISFKRTSNQSPHSYRKRSRKGSPKRSPLF